MVNTKFIVLAVDERHVEAYFVNKMLSLTTFGQGPPNGGPVTALITPDSYKK